MKTYKILFSLLLASVFLITACQQDDYELGTMLSKSEINYEVIQEYSIDEGGNTVILRNNTPGTVSMWDYGTGRSTRMVDTIRFAFQGEYVIKFSAVTAGGIVEMDPVTIEVTADNLNYVNDPLWTALTGGVGNSKTWVLDNGQYGFSPGPLSYADPSREQVWGNYQPNWEPDNAGHTEDDLNAEMTFSLMGGPFMTTVKPNEPQGEESGTFFLDIDNHTLTTTDATIIRLASFIPNATNWNENLNILELDENRLRVAVMRTNDEGPWWYIFNYVSKEYADNYVPEDPGFVPDPNFDHGNQMDILAGNSASTWKLSTNTPFNWMNLEGGFLNDWYAVGDYAEWTGFNEDAIADFENVRLTFSKTGDVTLQQNNGDIEYGSFSVEEKTNLISFQGIEPSIYISGGWVYASTSDYHEDDEGNVISGENQWKIVRTERVSDIVTDIWFGKRDPAKPEYMVFHFQLVSGTPDVKREMIKGLCGAATGSSSRTFKVDLDWPVDWTNPIGVGWTVPGEFADWYWNDDIAASVENQTITFSQVDGEVTVTKKNEDGDITSSPVEIDGDNRTIIISDIDIIQFGAGSWLPTSGPNYKWVRGEFNQVESNGFWIGVKSGDTEYTAYHYILIE